MKGLNRLEKIIIFRDIVVVASTVPSIIFALMRIRIVLVFFEFVQACLIGVNAKDSRRLMKMANSEDEKDHYLLNLFVPHLIMHILLSVGCFVSWLRIAIAI